MTYIMVDVEADGPIPADYSMICFGAIVIDKQLDKTFYGQLTPIIHINVNRLTVVTTLVVDFQAKATEVAPTELGNYG